MPPPLPPPLPPAFARLPAHAPLPHTDPTQMFGMMRDMMAIMQKTQQHMQAQQ